MYAYMHVNEYWTNFFCAMDFISDILRMPGLAAQPFNYEGYSENIGVEWKKWLRSFEIMLRACRIDDDDWKKDLLLHFVGSNVQQIFDSLPELPNSCNLLIASFLAYIFTILKITFTIFWMSMIESNISTMFSFISWLSCCSE